MKWIYILVGLLIPPIIVNTIMFIPSPWSVRGSYSDWITFFGNFSGGFIGAIVALIIAKNQVEQEKGREEQKRLLNQLNGLIRAKFEVKKISRNLSILEHTKKHYIESREQKGDIDPVEDFHYHSTDLENINEDNWSSLDIDDKELFYDLLDVKDFYLNFTNALKLDSNKLKFKIKELKIQKEIKDATGNGDPFDLINNEFHINNQISNLEDEIDSINHKKQIMWDHYYLKGYYHRSQKLLEQIDELINKISNLKKSENKLSER